MKKQTRRKFSSAFKAKVAIEAIKGQQTTAELAQKFELSQVVISRWKTEFLAGAGSVFDKSANQMNQMLTLRSCMRRPWATQGGK